MAFYSRFSIKSLHNERDYTNGMTSDTDGRCADYNKLIIIK